jgi:GDP-L-fucose synthase
MYVDTVNMDRQVEDAITGMLSKLDPHSAYTNAADTKKLNEPLKGNFDGIGVQFNMLDDTLVVIQPVANGPSERVGIVAGDRIVTVNDTSIAGVKMSREDIMGRLRGPKGTKVRLGVVRRGIGDVLSFTVQRDKIPAKSLDASLMLRPGVGLVRFSNFAATTHDEVTGAIRELQRQGYHNIITRAHANLDLTRQTEVEAFFREERPEYVFLAAAKVGGIVANETALADFMYQNMMLEMNVIHAAWQNGCRKLEFLGSSCIYPRMAPQPMTESCLLTGSLEKTNEAYALAKISGLKYCEFLNRQYGTDFISVMPTNLYGPNDNYHPEHSHVVPALIRRFHEAKVNGAKSVTCWGDGSPLREFLYVDDLAELCVHLMNTYSGNETVNAGTGKEITIRALTELVARVVGYEGEICWDTSRPNGTPRKLLDVSKATALGWTYKTELEDGIRLAYKDFMENPMRAER